MQDQDKSSQPSLLELFDSVSGQLLHASPRQTVADERAGIERDIQERVFGLMVKRESRAVHDRFSELDDVLILFLRRLARSVQPVGVVREIMEDAIEELSGERLPEREHDYAETVASASSVDTLRRIQEGDDDDDGSGGGGGALSDEAVEAVMEELWEELQQQRGAPASLTTATLTRLRACLVRAAGSVDGQGTDAFDAQLKALLPRFAGFPTNTPLLPRELYRLAASGNRGGDDGDDGDDEFDSDDEFPDPEKLLQQQPHLRNDDDDDEEEEEDDALAVPHFLRMTAETRARLNAQFRAEAAEFDRTFPQLAATQVADAAQSPWSADMADPFAFSRTI